MIINELTPVYVEFIPQEIEGGKLYICDEYDIAVHLCCCGCEEKVVTPFSPVEWRYDEGPNGVSLYPSIGNWDYECRSHYVIRDNQVIWAKSMTEAQIQRVKQRDNDDMQAYIRQQNASRRRSWIMRMFTNIWKAIKAITRR